MSRWARLLRRGGTPKQTPALGDPFGLVPSGAGTPVRLWAGTTAAGLCAGRKEIFSRPALTVLLARIHAPTPVRAPESCEDPDGGRACTGAFPAPPIPSALPALGIVHADSGHPGAEEALRVVGDRYPGVPWVGGVAGGGAGGRHAPAPPTFLRIRQQGSDFTGEGATTTAPFPPSGSRGQEERGPEDGAPGAALSGILLSGADPVLIGFAHGCEPIGPAHRVTGTRGHIVTHLEERPAAEVLRQDVGELLARDLRRVAGYIHVLVREHPDREGGDGPGGAAPETEKGALREDVETARSLIGIDRRTGALALGGALGGPMPTGGRLRFCRREPQGALERLRSMLDGLTGRLEDRAPRAALYYPCMSRGPNLLGPGSHELGLVREALGPVPLAGFFSEGTLAHARVHALGATLVLFL